MEGLTALEELDLSGNKELVRLPDWIGYMKSLKKLVISYCGLTELPERYACMYTCLVTRSILTMQCLSSAFFSYLKQNNR